MQSKKKQLLGCLEGPESVPKAFGPIQFNSKGRPCLGYSDSSLGLLGCLVRPGLVLTWACFGPKGEKAQCALGLGPKRNNVKNKINKINKKTSNNNKKKDIYIKKGH